MKISNPFNRFYHGVVLQQTKQIKHPIKIKLGRDWFQFRPSGISFDSLKQLLKIINLEYPRDNDKPKSTVKIDNKELCDHIEFCIRLLGENGLTYRFIDDEWKKLIGDIR